MVSMWASASRTIADGDMISRALQRFARRALRHRPDRSLQRAFDVWARPWTTLFLVIGMIAYGAIVLLALWPLDWLTFADSPERASFAWLRASNLAICGISLVGVTTRFVRRHVVAWTGCTVVACGLSGAWNASRLPHDPFYWPGIFALIGLGFLLVPLLQRLVWVAVLGVGYNVIWYARNPAQWRDPATPPMLALFFGAMVLAVANGQAIHSFAWQVFHRQRELDRKRSELFDFNQQLESEVTRKTSELRRLAQRVERLHEDERRRLASELHDELGQTLTALRLEVAMLEKEADAKKSAGALHAQLDDLFESVRWLVSSLRPKALEERGLVAGCEWLVERFRARTGVETEAVFEEVAIDEGESLTVFRVLQEALTNVARHADARRVVIGLGEERDSIALSIEDDGVGIPADMGTEGHGLRAMRERALAIDATLVIEPRAPGTRIVLRLPRGAS
jgi:signal transduction histidine kinase